LFFSVPMPVAMLTRCIVVAGAAVVKQSTREKKQCQSVLSEARAAFPLRIKNVFMHITVARSDWPNSSAFL